MNKRNQLTRLALLSAAGFASLSVSAAIVNSTATATVKNTFTLTNPTPLSFGNVRAIRGDDTEVATLVVSADPSVLPDDTDDGDATISSISGVTRAVFEIAGAAPFGEFTITFPATDVNLNADPAVVGPGQPPLILMGGAANWSAYMLTGPRANQPYAAVAGSLLQATTTGSLRFNVGATLATQDPGVASPAVIYPDAVYSGNYSLIVNY